jgi:hypothetical protein
MPLYLMELLLHWTMRSVPHRLIQRKGRAYVLGSGRRDGDLAIEIWEPDHRDDYTVLIAEKDVLHGWLNATEQKSNLEACQLPVPDNLSA